MWADGVLLRQLRLHSPQVIQLEQPDVVGSSATEVDTMNALILLVIVALISVVLFSSLNRKTVDRVSTARNRLRKQASALRPYSVSEFLKDAGLAEDDHRAHALLGVLAGMLEVEPDKLAHNYQMRDLLVISIDSDGQNQQQTIDPFSCELLEKVVALSDKRLWDQKWSDKPELPRIEEDLLDFITKMSVGEFLRFFSPLIKSASG